MHSELSISAEWEYLDQGMPEERACFAALGIQCNGHWLTEGSDGLVNRLRNEPLLSAYHLAEWAAWNWWRLRWEPRSSAADWSFAHRTATIGHGYVWPNITIFSDGERTALIARPTTDRAVTAFRYISDYTAIVPSKVFERAVDEFIGQVLGQLQAEGVAETNLNRIWSELTDERQNSDAARRRKLEALLGYDPDEADQGTIEQLIADAEPLGEQAVEELAADHLDGSASLSAKDLEQIAQQHGFPSSPCDAVHLNIRGALALPFDVAAWRLGAAAAAALRSQEGLGEGPIGDAKLAGLAGVGEQILVDNTTCRTLSFALDQNQTAGKVVLRSRWPTGRRFELARLLADRLVKPPIGKLHAATRARTYRQKMQRSFAAELLSPFEAVDGMLAGDYSEEAQQEVAQHFKVSDYTIRTLLVNHRRLDRELWEDELGAAA